MLSTVSPRRSASPPALESVHRGESLRHAHYTALLTSRPRAGAVEDLRGEATDRAQFGRVE